MQLGTVVDVERLKLLVEGAEPHARPRLWTAVREVLVQHSLAILLGGLRTVPVPPYQPVRPRLGLACTEPRFTALRTLILPL